MVYRNHQKSATPPKDAVASNAPSITLFTCQKGSEEKVLSEKQSYYHLRCAEDFALVGRDQALQRRHGAGDLRLRDEAHDPEHR